MTDKTFNVGIIGLGGMGRKMALAMQAHPRFAPLAGWDPCPHARAAATDELPELQQFSTPSDVIEHKDVNALYVASPPGSHSRYVLEAIQLRKPLLCEKPLGVVMGESRKISSAAAKRSLPTAMNFNHGTHAGADWLAAEVSSGRLGQVSGVSVQLHVPAWPRPFQAHAEWLAFRDQGGFTREMLSHWLYLTTKLLGAGELVQARATYPEDPALAETAVQAHLNFSGVPVQVSGLVGGDGPIGVEYTLWAEKASYRFKSGGAFLTWDGGDWKPAEIADDGKGQGDARMLDALTRTFEGESGLLPTLEDGLAVQELIEGILASE